MLTELKLANFRLFNDEVTVRFRPITVLIGRNSSGKSSIVKFLLMLKQSLGPGKPQFLSPEGEGVNLGIFSELKNCLSRKRNLTFELVVKNPLQTPTYAIWEHYRLSEQAKRSMLLFKADASVSYSKKTNVGHANYSLVDEVTSRSIMKIDTKILDDSAFLDFPSMSVLESELNQAFANPENPLGKSADDSTIESLMKYFSENSYQTFNRYITERELLDVLRYQIDSLRHLSPVRNESQRVILVASPPIDHVGQRGQHALVHLQQMMIDHRPLYNFILPHLRSVAGIDDIDFVESSGYVSRVLAKNRTTGAEVLIADYGFGVSQCLPIFVQGAIMPPHTTLMVEQPEAQLHPTAQVELGSFFADLWQQRQVASIIETHSRNILLRLRRLIANGELAPEDVSVAYFTVDEQNNNMPIVKNLDINEDGSMEAGLPMEFFGADIMEGLKIGARA